MDHAASFSPHELQNLLPGGLKVLHLAHFTCSSDAPHVGQNLVFRATVDPQE